MLSVPEIWLASGITRAGEDRRDSSISIASRPDRRWFGTGDCPCSGSLRECVHVVSVEAPLVSAALVSAVLAGCGQASSDEQYVSIARRSGRLASRLASRLSSVSGGPDGDSGFLLVAQGSCAGRLQLERSNRQCGTADLPSRRSWSRGVNFRRPTTTLAEIASRPPACPAEDGCRHARSRLRSLTRCASTTKSTWPCSTPPRVRSGVLPAETPITVNNFVTLAGGVTTTAPRSSGAIRRSTSFRAAPRTESPSDPGQATRSPTSRSLRRPALASSAYRYVPGQLVMARTALPNSSSAVLLHHRRRRSARRAGRLCRLRRDRRGRTRGAAVDHRPARARWRRAASTVTVNSVTIEVS